ncbi:hypothetical protein FSP39_022704 [Pinctada imbricata]|uniref:Protein kinase domain-containing protein n=1 Tax=Pinctada imbricata TaxID=66713 RepID=A0AA88XSL8_PINIB|nr:hypothetical protein FSP39_022704 [Pinctada imbricata]
MEEKKEPTVVIETDHVRMKKSINLLHCVAILVAVTGHISVFVSPTEIFRNAGSIGLYLILWVVGGMVNVGTCLCFVEFATMFPNAGGPYAYVMTAFGPLAGFLILWGYMLLVCGPFWAFVSYSASLYILQPMYTDCTPPESGVKLLAGWILLTLVMLNCLYMKYVTKVQTILSTFKLLGLLLIILGGAIAVAKGEVRKENFENVFEETSRDPGKISMGLFFSIFIYGGWDLPRAVYISFVIVIIKYLLVNCAYFTLLSPTTFLLSDAVAVTFTQLVAHWTTHLLSVFVGLCCVGVANAAIMGHSRNLFAGARNGHAPIILGTLSIQYLTPWAAIFVLTMWSLVMLYSGSVNIFMQFIQAFSTYMSINVIAALLYLRWTLPNKHRPYKVNIVNAVVQLVVQVVILLLALFEEPYKIGTAFAIIIAGAPVYWIGVTWKAKPAVLDSTVVFHALMTLKDVYNYVAKALLLSTVKVQIKPTYYDVIVQITPLRAVDSSLTMSEFRSYLPLDLTGTISPGSYIYSLPVITDQYVDGNTYTRADGTSVPYVLKSAIDVIDQKYSEDDFLDAFNACTTTNDKRSLRNHFYRYILPRLKSEGTLQQLSKLLVCGDDQIRYRVIEAMRNLVLGLDFEKLKIKYVSKALREVASYLISQDDEGRDDGIRLFTDLTMILLVKEKVLQTAEKPIEIQWRLREAHQIVTKASKKDKGLVLNSLNWFIGKCLKLKMSKQGMKLIENWSESTIAGVDVDTFTQNIQGESPAEIYLLLLGFIYKLKISTMPSSIVNSFVKITHALTSLSVSDDQFKSIVLYHAQSQIPGLVLREGGDRNAHNLVGKRSDHSTWLCMNGTFMSCYEVEIKVLVPGRHPTKFLTPGENSEFKNTETEFEILKHIQGSQQHINVAQMLAFYDTSPRTFAMFAIEICGETLLKHLYSVRSRNEELPFDWKVRRCLEMLNAIDFLHHHNIVHRDIMAQSFSLRSQGPEKGSAVLTSIRRAIHTEVDFNTSISGHVRVLNPTQIPTRWSAPESFLQDKFDRMSDIWMFGHVIREVFTYGCQPYTEIYSEDTENIMVKVIYCGLKPYKWPCIPMSIHALTLECFEMDPENRPTTTKLFKGLKDIQKKESVNPRRSIISGVYGSVTGSSIFPKLTEGQQLCEPERGIPKLVRDLRKQKSEDPRDIYMCLKYEGKAPKGYNIIRARELSAPDAPKIESKPDGLFVKEPVSRFFYEKILPKMSEDFAEKMKIKTWPLDPHLSDENNNFPFDIEYTCPSGTNIMRIARQSYSPEEHLGHMLAIAKFMEKMHKKYWILVDVCGRSFYLSKNNKEVFMPRIGRMLRLEIPFDQDNDTVDCPTTYKNRIHWHPVEVIRNSEYSMNSDVYMLAMVFYEYFTAVGFNKVGVKIDRVVEMTASVPFASTEYSQMMEKLLSGEIPMKPSECPEWLYDDIMKPCWSQERTSRPSIKQIVSLMKERLGIENISTGGSTHGQVYASYSQDKASGESGSRYEELRPPYDSSSPHSIPKSPNMQRKTASKKEHTYVQIIDDVDSGTINDRTDMNGHSNAQYGNIDTSDSGVSPKPCRK